MSAGRRLALVAAALLAGDVLLALVTPGQSLLSPLGAPAVGPGGLALRLVLLAVLAAPLAVPRRGLWLLLMATLVHFHASGGRLSGDGVMYYVQLRSLAKDADLDLTNEYHQFGLLDRPDLRVPTRTGRRRTVFSVGPALLGLPFFAAAEAIGRGGRLLGLRPDLSGYGPLHVNAVALGGLLYGFAALWLVESALRRHFAARTARLVVVALWLATFLYWYMVHQPVMSHTHSAFAAAAVVAYWDRTRGVLDVRRALILGLLMGLAICVRWQNAALLALPAGDAVAALVRRRRAGASEPKLGAPLLPLAVLALAAAAGALPQMAAWRTVFGEWLLAAPPQGTDFVRLDRPFVLETLFSSRHGLLSWTPVLWTGLLGFAPLARRRPALAAALAVPLLALTYVNMCSGDWWAGGSFSNRRFDSVLPLLAFGMAAFAEAAARALRRRPLAAVLAAALGLVAWNVALVQARRDRRLPADDTMSFAQMAGGLHDAVAARVGSPAAWPANWLFAARYGLPPERFDELAGRYLFYRQNSQMGCLDLALAGDAPLLDGGWAAPTDAHGGRRLLGRARVWVGLDQPEPLRVTVRASAEAPAVVAVGLNGRPLGQVAIDGARITQSLDAPAALWRRDLNVIELEPAGTVHVQAIGFERQGVDPPPCPAEKP